MSEIDVSAGTLSNKTISSGQTAFVYNSGKANQFKIISGGKMYIAGGSATGTIVSSGGLLEIWSGAASTTTVSNGGRMIFSSACRISSINTVLAGGYARIESGAVVSSLTASNGASLALYATAKTNYEPATVFNVISNGVTLKCDGSSFAGWDMKTSGSYLRLGGLSAASVNVSSGCSMDIGGTSRFNSASVGKVNVYNGGKVSFVRVDTVGLITIHPGGELFTADGATESATIMENGGNLRLYYGEEMLNDPGYRLKIKPNTFYNVTAAGDTYDYQYVTAHSGTTAVNTTLYEYGTLEVFNGGRAFNTVLSKGSLDISSGGIASNVINAVSGGGIHVGSGGKVTGLITLSGTMIVSSGGIVDFDISDVRGGAAPRFTNYYFIPTNLGYVTLTMTVSGRQPDGIYTLATGAYQIANKTTDAEKTLTIYNTSGSKLGAVKLGQTVKIGSASYSLKLESGYLSVTISGSAPANPAKSDINANNRSDVLFQFTGGDYQTGFWKDGTNNWQGQGVLHSKDWTLLGAHDMNGDGKADTVYVGNVTVNGVKGAYIGYYDAGIDTDANWKNIGFLTNSDGIAWKNTVGNLTGTYSKNDIVWHAPSLGVLGVWTDGTGNWTSLGSGFDSKWAIVGTGDFNGNGQEAVLMSHSGGNYYYAVDIYGNITPMGASNGGWEVRAIGDFYGDGKDDIIVFNKAYGLVDVWSDGSTSVDVNIGQLNANDWFVAGAGDYDGDGKDDLLVRQISTGMLGYYTGANMQSGWKTLGYGVSTAWTVIA